MELDLASLEVSLDTLLQRNMKNILITNRSMQLWQKMFTKPLEIVLEENWGGLIELVWCHQTLSWVGSENEDKFSVI